MRRQSGSEKKGDYGADESKGVARFLIPGLRCVCMSQVQKKKIATIDLIGLVSLGPAGWRLPGCSKRGRRMIKESVWM
jgi:hypothetical protein